MKRPAPHRQPPSNSSVLPLMIRSSARLDHRSLEHISKRANLPQGAYEAKSLLHKQADLTGLRSISPVIVAIYLVLESCNNLRDNWRTLPRSLQHELCRPIGP